MWLGELNCMACHAGSNQAAGRITSRQSPILGEAGLALTPHYLRAYLADPHATKPGNTMPDVLGGLPADERAQVVDALTHFLVKAAGETTAEDTSVDTHQIQVGQRLFHEVGCVACHAPQAAPVVPGASTASPSQEWKKLANESVPMSDLASKTTVASLARFLVDPLSSRPSGRMPSFGLTGGEASALAMYLVRDQSKPENTGATAKRIPGLTYQYFEENMGGGDPNFDKFAPKSSGMIEKLEIRGNRRGEGFGFRYRGDLRVTVAGEYTFRVRSDDGSRLWIDGKLVVNNWGDHAPQEVEGRMELAAGEHTFQLVYFNNGGGGELAVTWQGPGIPKSEIPSSAFSFVGLPMRPVGSKEFQVENAKVSEGRRRFEQLGCAACHEVRSKDASLSVALTPKKAKTLETLNAATPGGCVKRTNLSQSPDFRLSDDQRALISEALSRVRRGLPLAEPVSRVNHRMAALNCFACHARGPVGGPQPVRSDYFSIVGEADLGDEGRIPPHLTRVGEKLRSDWLREVLWNRGSVRPYMATRMPQFGRSNLEALAADMGLADGAPTFDEKLVPPTKDAKWGRKLVGREGLSCIACHTFAQRKSLGIPAMDLTHMTRRLRRTWFQRYLEDPPSLRPGTRMPSFWPEGKAANQEILGGDTARQIGAIWSYLSKGAQAEVPEGLIQGRQELVVDKEPVIYRNFIEGAGSRAIGVGFPEHAHLAFDANELRVAMLWRGAFIDASRHRTDRGVGYEPPMGDDILTLPAGPPFATLNTLQTEWPSAVGRAAGYRMLGYRLDTLRRPVFMYALGEVGIEDQLVPQKGDPDSTFQRVINLMTDTPSAGLYFRAAVGKRIERQATGWVVDGKWTVRVRVEGRLQPTVREVQGQRELLVPVEWNEGRCRISEEIIW